MSEFPWNSLFTLLGVALGFALSQGAEAFKGRSRKELIRKALHNELGVAYSSVARATTKSGLVLDDYPLITDTYDSVRVELTAMLDASKLAKVERAYRRIKELNEPVGGDNPRGYIPMALGELFLYQHNLTGDLKVIEEGISVLRDISFSFNATFQIVMGKLGVAKLLRKATHR